MPLRLEPGEEAGSRKVVYEVGCELPAGSHVLDAAVLDSASQEIGAVETDLPVKDRAPGVAGDVILWTSSSGDVLVAADAAGVGIRDTGSGHGFVPRGERRFGAREAVLLYVIVCPPPAEGQQPGATIEVKRSIFAGDQEVASFQTVQIGSSAVPQPGNATASVGAEGPSSGGAAPGSACEGIFAPIPPGRLGPGGYTYQVMITGLGPEPVVHRAGFAVEGTASRQPGS